MFAVISDVHGNLSALRAALTDVERRGITQVYCLGDIVGKSPRGHACIQLLRQRAIPTVQGNWDHFISGSKPLGPSLRWWREELTDDDRAWLAALPRTLDVLDDGARTRLFHASPTSVYDRYYADMTQPEAEAMFILDDAPTPDVIVYGDIHDPYAREVVCAGKPRILANSGAIGNNLGRSGGVPTYALVTGQSVELVSFSYDVAGEVAVSAQLGNPDHDFWADELLRGIYHRRG